MRLDEAKRILKKAGLSVKEKPSSYKTAKEIYQLAKENGLHVDDFDGYGGWIELYLDNNKIAVFDIVNDATGDDREFKLSHVATNFKLPNVAIKPSNFKKSYTGNVDELFERLVKKYKKVKTALKQLEIKELGDDYEV